MRGYRLLARRAGFSGQRPASDQSKDVAQNCISLGEVVRACRWKPHMAMEPAYASLGEFKLRSSLAKDPLPPGAAGVFRNGSETFVRSILQQAVQRSWTWASPASPTP